MYFTSILYHIIINILIDRVYKIFKHFLYKGHSSMFMCFFALSRDNIIEISFKIWYFSAKNTKKGIDKPENECYNNMPHE